MMAEPTPWRAMIARAQALGVSPQVFWRLSFAEWRALIAPPTPDALSRKAFDALTERFPDR
jgi:uncharacterized phage protein (TIGR02216 family)